MKKNSNKKRRRLLGIGHPYFINAPNAPSVNGTLIWPSALVLLSEDRGLPTQMNTCSIGAWKKVKVYLEWTD